MDVFAEARRLTTWHYQWLIVHEFLPQIVGQAMLDDVLRHGRRFYTPAPRRGLHAGRVPDRHLPDGAQHGAAVVPREPRRRQRAAVLRLHLRPVAGGQAPTPTTCAAARARRAGSSAGRPSSTSATARSSRTRRSTRRSRRPLFNLPLGAIASHDAPTALPQRNLLRHLTWQLPVGAERRARDGRHAARRAPTCRSWRRSASASSAARRCGTTSSRRPRSSPTACTSGPVGGRIVAEVLIGLLQTDPAPTSRRSRAGGRRCRARPRRSA